MLFLSLFTHVFCLLIFLITKRAIAVDSSLPSDMLAMRGSWSRQREWQGSNVFNRNRSAIMSSCLIIPEEKRGKVQSTRTTSPTETTQFCLLYSALPWASFEMPSSLKLCILVSQAAAHRGHGLRWAGHGHVIRSGGDLVALILLTGFGCRAG